MKIRYCSRCKKNIAVVFVTKIENGKTVSEGLCLKCARQMGIRQVEDVMQNMGITDKISTTSRKWRSSRRKR